MRTTGGIDQKITWFNIMQALNPVGTIKMFDANNVGGGGTPAGVSGAWIDDTTIPGWYACIAGNSDHGCPNLVDKFIMGKVIAGAAGTGGANSITITSAMLPVHTHTINHDHPNKTSTTPSANNTAGSTVNTGNQLTSHTHSHTHGAKTSGNNIGDHKHDTVMGSHTHNVYGHGATEPPVGPDIADIHTVNHTQILRSGLIYSTDLGTKESGNQKTAHTHSTTIGVKVSGNQSADHAHSMQAHTHAPGNHTHDVDIVAFNGSSGNGGFANDAFNNRPAYYSVIFIRKCA